jgi:uncharacterized cupredoxin-like copper-binding protein
MYMSALRRSGLPAVLVAAALVLSACGGNGTDNGNDNGNGNGNGNHDDHQVLEVDAGEFYFEPEEMRVAADEPVMLVLRNVGGVEHDFTIDDPAVDVYAAVGETAEEEIGSFAAGTYDVYCSIPGHREAGMVATLIAE